MLCSPAYGSSLAHLWYSLFVVSRVKFIEAIGIVALGDISKPLFLISSFLLRSNRKERCCVSCKRGGEFTVEVCYESVVKENPRNSNNGEFASTERLVESTVPKSADGVGSCSVD